MSKETKLAKKEQKAAKKAAKLEKSQSKAYDKLVKKIEKKNAKAEKKANKKGKPFVPTPIPTQEEAFAAAGGGKVKKIILLIILILLIWFLVYFIVMWFNYVAPPAKEETTTNGEMAEYERYSNPHEITTTPDYSVSDAKLFLKQTIHDCYRDLGYTSDPSSGSINYTSSIINVNNDDCYVFTASGKTYAVSVKLRAVYVKSGNEYKPLTFRGTDIIFD